MWADIVTLVGLALTLSGAGVTAQSVVLSEDDAINIGLARFAGETREENLQQPAVQNLLHASKSARYGLWIVVMGTALQALPVIFHLFLK